MREHRNPPCIVGLFLLCVAVMLGGCGTRQSVAPKDSPPKLMVAAAADLSLAFKELGPMFEKAQGVSLEFSFGSTGLLAQQIDNGAPFDVFAAANVKFVEDLKAKGKVVADTQKLYARGRIGLTTLRSKPFPIKEISDLLRPEIKKVAIANPAHAPYGLAAKQALQKAGVWDALQEKLVYGNNIQDTLNLIKTGNAEAGIIALSLHQPEVLNFSLIDGALHDPLDQAIAVVSHSQQKEPARRFIEFVNSPAGRVVMNKYGFTLPGEK